MARTIWSDGPDLSQCGAGGQHAFREVKLIRVELPRSELSEAGRVRWGLATMAEEQAHSIASRSKRIMGRPPEISDEEVRALRVSCACGMKDETAAMKYGISPSYVAQLRRHEMRPEAGGPRVARKRGRKTNRVWSDEQVRHMHAAFAAGASWNEVGRFYGIDGRRARTIVSRRLLAEG
jgi:hypothetical protein